MFRPLGTVIPGSVLADIGGFMNKDQIQEFSLLSPRTNAIFKKNRLLQYDSIDIQVVESELVVSSYSVQADPGDNYDQMEIDLDKENPVKKLSLFLSTCREIDEFSWYGDTETKTLWNIDEIDEHLLKLMLNIKFKNYLIIGSSSINVSLSLFTKFLLRNGKILETIHVKLPSEFISNKSLRLISKVGIECINGIDPVVDVNDDVLEETTSAFHLSNCSTQITIKGIKAFLEKFQFGTVRREGDDRTSFGTLGSDQLLDAIAFAEEHVVTSSIDLWSVNGHKTLSFLLRLIRINSDLSFQSLKISLDKRDEDPLGMVPIPEHFVGPVDQANFVHFEKICHNPDVNLSFNQYHMKNLSLYYQEDNTFVMHCVIKNDEQPRGCSINIRRTNVDINMAQKIIFVVLKNCTAIDRLIWRVPLTDDLYKVLKPISPTINIRKTRSWPKTEIEIQLSSAYLRELQQTNDGLFGAFDLP